MNVQKINYDKYNEYHVNLIVCALYGYSNTDMDSRVSEESIGGVCGRKSMNEMDEFREYYDFRRNIQGRNVRYTNRDTTETTFEYGCVESECDEKKFTLDECNKNVANDNLMSFMNDDIVLKPKKRVSFENVEFDVSENKQIVRNENVSLIDKVEIYNNIRNGEMLTNKIILYQRRVSGDTIDEFDLTTDGNAVSEHNLLEVGSFQHIKCTFYSFIGKNKSDSIIYNSLTEYEMWIFKNKSMYYILDLNQDTDVSRDPKEEILHKVIYSIEPNIQSHIRFYIMSGRLCVKMSIQGTSNKNYVTSYMNMNIIDYKTSV